MKNVLKPLGKSVLTPLGSTAAASAAYAAIHKKIFGSSTTTLTIFNEEMNDIMKIVKSLEESSLLTKGVNEEKMESLGMLLGILDASLLGNLLTGKGTIRAGKGAIAMIQGSEANTPGKGTIRAG